MSKLETIFKLKPKLLTPDEEKRAAHVAEVKKRGEQIHEEAKRDFENMRPELEKRLAEIPADINNLERELAEIELEIKKQLETEREILKNRSPLIDSSLMNPARTQIKRLLTKTDGLRREISNLESEKRTIGSSIQRGY